MARFSEDFIRCMECEGADFIQDEFLTINIRAANLRVKRDKSEPIPPELIEKEIVYKCARCGQTLDI